MKKAHYFALIVYLSLCLFPKLFSSELTIELGRKDQWKDIIFSKNVIFQNGKWGDLDILLEDNEYKKNQYTDLLLHFNHKTTSDITGNYSISGKPQLSTTSKILGKGSYLFEENINTISLKPVMKNALFQAGQFWGDFTIEFWINPLTLGDGESIFNWDGARLNKNQVISQSIECTIQNRKLQYEFHNFFAPPNKGEFKIILKGLEAMIPGRWYHHLVRFNSESGLIEYLVNGIPEDIQYTTLSGKENGTICIPETGSAYPGSILLGEKYTGYLDEFLISKNFNESPHLKKYSTNEGEIITKPFNLDYTGSWIYSLLSDESTPMDSEIFYYYRIANSLSNWNNLDNTWIEYSPGDLSGKTIGKYIQLRVLFEPSGNLSHSPILSSLKIIYEPDFPPPPPIDLMAKPGNSQIQLSWKPVYHQDIAGYLIFYGSSPGNYTGTDSILGKSPIDVGNKTEFTITGLQNGKLYYFAIVAYDSTQQAHNSAFSREISARPSGLAQ